MVPLFSLAIVSRLLLVLYIYMFVHAYFINKNFLQNELHFNRNYHINNDNLGTNNNMINNDWPNKCFIHFFNLKDVISYVNCRQTVQQNCFNEKRKVS